ncbi:hypothetical protein [Rhodoferax sp. GW822-FHT02A01]|uniref:hypothetical protein n=1 Tax=Rhodoferax sp. GW822-FHT02A01 TaxID=3141537 RepID=UPI00315D6F35
MARIRSIKPEFWVSEQVAECSPNARLTFIGMWNFCDDRGVHPAKPKTLKAELFPMDDVTSIAIAEWVNELIAVGLVAEFEHADASYWHVTGWGKHQKIDKPSYKYPAPETAENSDKPLIPFVEDSSNASRAPPPGVDRSGVDRSGGEIAPSPKARPSSDKKPRKTAIPADFAVSDRVKVWAEKHGHTQLDQHLEHFVGKAIANGYTYADWDEALMNAIRGDWAKLSVGLNGTARNGLESDELFGGNA